MRKIALRLTRMRPIGRGYAMRGGRYARLRRAGGTERGRERGGAESRERRERDGMPPHGGFAIGLERITACFLGIANVKECSMFPRDINRVAP